MNGNRWKNLYLVRQSHGQKYGLAQRYGSLKMATTNLSSRIFWITHIVGVSGFILSTTIFAKSNLSFYQHLCLKRMNKKISDFIFGFVHPIFGINKKTISNKIVQIPTQPFSVNVFLNLNVTHSQNFDEKFKKDVLGSCINIKHFNG